MLATAHNSEQDSELDRGAISVAAGTERKDGEAKHEPGYFDGLDVSREDAEAMIMQARLKAGWVTEAELAPPPAPEEAAPAEAPQT